MYIGEDTFRLCHVNAYVFLTANHSAFNRASQPQVRSAQKSRQIPVGLRRIAVMHRDARRGGRNISSAGQIILN
jgi:hypothetical protein